MRETEASQTIKDPDIGRDADVKSRSEPFLGSGGWVFGADAEFCQEIRRRGQGSVVGYGRL